MAARSSSVRRPSGLDYWAVLGLEPGADPSALKRAFRAQARRWHPDLNGNDPVAEERFKQVNEAYAVLSDLRRRRAWEAGEGSDAQADGAGASDPFASGFPSFQAYLDALFGPWRPPGEELDVDGSVDSPPERAGSVSPADVPPPPVQASSSIESLVELTPTQALQGSRVELELPDGTVVEVDTPSMAGDGWRLRLQGVAPGGADHFLQLRVVTSEGLRIDGLRVLFTLDLSPSEAALGCRVVVPTLDGDVQLTVPPGSSSGRLLRLRGRGQHQGQQRGDQLVELRIVVPEHPSETEQALYRRLLELARSRE